MEKEDTISVQCAQEDVETSYNLLNNNNIYIIYLIANGLSPGASGYVCK